MGVSADPEVVEALSAVWPGASPALAPLEGGITNRNFVVEVGGERFVLRIAGANTELLGIDRRAEIEAARAAWSVGVGPEVVASLPDAGILVTRFAPGEPIPEADLATREVLALVVAAVEAIHSGRRLGATFDAFRVVEAYMEVAASRGVQIPPAYDDAHALAARIEEACGVRPMPRAPCHNDLLNANLLRDGDRVWIVDHEYAGMGDPFFDLGNLSINNGLPPDAQELLLGLYFGEVRDGHRARLGLMRVMSDFREAMWGVVQQGVSTLDFDYVAYADEHFERLLRSAADPLFEDWLTTAQEVP